MKILITGSSGFLGRRASAYLSSLGHQILAPSHTQFDITDRSGMDICFRQHHPQIVLHCAAISDTGLCQREPERSHEINVTGSANLARACAKYDSKLIFCSSDQVYAGSPLPGPHLESEPLTPATVYAQHKLQAEQLCRELCPDTVSLRLSWMYACQFLPEEHGHLLTVLHDVLHHDSTSIFRSVYDFRGITDVDSVIRHLPAAISLPAGVYNFGAENDLDSYNTLRTVFETLGLQDALQRLVLDPQAFHRDIRMDSSLAASYGISFESTQAGLIRALSQCI